MDNLEDSSTPFILSWNKLKTLPRVIEEYQNVKLWYQRIKSRHWKIGKFCTVSEFFLVTLMSVLSTILCSEVLSPLVCWSLGKVRLVDEFFCHQLDFLEKQLKTLDTAWIYKPNGIIDRLYLASCLMLRLMFFFPRLFYRFTFTTIDITINESMENLDLFMMILSPPKARRSRRIKGQCKKSQSPGKKRKHEEIENLLPHYFYVHECSQESDPDFVPDSDRDDTGVASASDQSDDEDSGEEVDVSQDEELSISDALDVASVEKKLAELNEDEPHNIVSNIDVIAG